MDENVETLIEEVEKRPAIYDKTLKEYANTNIKRKCVQQLFPTGRTWKGILKPKQVSSFHPFYYDSSSFAFKTEHIHVVFIHLFHLFCCIVQRSPLYFIVLPW
jgi:hypothetical protein